jgi:hypothetical protein
MTPRAGDAVLLDEFLDALRLGHDADQPSATCATCRPRLSAVPIPNSSCNTSSFWFHNRAPKWLVGRPSPTITISWHIKAACTD